MKEPAVEAYGFDAVFGSALDLAYQGSTIDEINKHRRSLENELFFDRLLKAIGIEQASKVYPPSSHQGLQELFSKIVDTTSPAHYQQSLIYYILKDLSHRVRTPDAFAEKTFLPKKYQIFIDGIWCLDKEQFEESLDYLTEPCLIPTFPEEILYTLCRHSIASPTLPLAYYYAVSPAITTQKVLNVFFTTLCRASTTEGFFFARKQGELAHRHLFEQLVSFVHGGSGGEVRAARALELVGLPLDDEEGGWLEEYLLYGKGKALYGAKDTVMMRLVTMGRTQEVAALGQTFSNMRKIDGMSWESLGAGSQVGKKVAGFG